MKYYGTVKSFAEKAGSSFITPETGGSASTRGHRLRQIVAGNRTPAELRRVVEKLVQKVHV